MITRNLPPDVIDEELYLQQQQEFQDLLLNGFNPECFIVKDLECAWGKSTFALNTLLLYKQQNPDKRILYVCERIEQCKDNADDVNKLFGGKEVAVAIVGGVSAKQRKQYLQDYDIIFITHERYRRLGRKYNKEERDLFTDNRHLLIIDEKIEMCKEIYFNLSKHINLEIEIEKLGGTKAREIYKQIVEGLVVSIKYREKSEVENKGIVLEFEEDINEIDNLITELKELIDSKVKDRRIFYIDFEDKDYQTIFERIDDLREFYTGQSIMYYDRENAEIVVGVPNYSMDYWLLENNIILDATASIDKSYSYNTNLFQITYEQKVFKHHKWTIEWADVNSTGNGRNNKYKNFPYAVNKVIEEKLGEQRTLVYATKYDDVIPVSKGSTELEKRKKFKGTVTHQGVVNSSNEFEHLQNGINADLNFVNEKSYVLKYLYYSRQKIKDWKSGRNGFTNIQLEELKVYDMARGLYQFFKRINRNMEMDSNVVFLCHRADIRDIVFSMFKDINIVHSTEIEDMFEKTSENNIEQFISMCKYILSNKKLPETMLQVLEKPKFCKFKDEALRGRIRKCVFAECVNTTGKSFGNSILNNKKSKDMQLFWKEYGECITKNNNFLIFKDFLK